MTVTALKILTYSAIVLGLVQSTSGSSCDGSAADSLAQEIDIFNSQLESYATLVASAARATPQLNPQNGKKLYERAANPIEFKVAVSTATAKQQVHVKEPHISDNKEATKQSVHIWSKAVITQVGVHSAVSAAQENVHFSTYIPIEEQHHEAMVKQSFESLKHQQSVLDSMENVCIPVSHKPKVAAALSKTLKLYLVHKKTLLGVTNVVKRAQEAAWLTMGNDVNSGYNGDDAELTASTSTSSTSTPAGYGYGNGYPGSAGYPPPQYSPQYVTVTVTPSTVATPTSTASSDDGDDDGDDGDDTPSASATAPAPPPVAASPHHGIIYDSTIGLVLGTLHLVEHVLGFGRGSQQLVKDTSSDLAEALDKVASEYGLKL